MMMGTCGFISMWVLWVLITLDLFGFFLDFDQCRYSFLHFWIIVDQPGCFWILMNVGYDEFWGF